MKIAYADPPYLGCGKKLYGKHHAEAAEYDKVDTHRHLIQRLAVEFPDGWALSLHTPSLETMLILCREVLGENRVRIGSWVKPFASFKPGVNPGYTWEPILFSGGRKRGRDIDTLRDYVSCNITLKKGLTGAKPEAVCHWIFDFLGMNGTDELHDIFPGTGAVSRAWETFKARSA